MSGVGGMIRDLANIPSSWEWARVKDVGGVTLGRQRSPKNHNGPHMRPYLRVANVYEDRIDTRNVLSMNFTPEEFGKFKLLPNDILLNEGQSLDLVGRPALYRGEVAGACFQNTLVRFRSTKAVEPKFALTIFRAYMHQGYFSKIARWTTNIAHLGAQRFADMDFPVPPLQEQRRIVEAIETHLSKLDDAVANLERVRANLKRYRASVLKAAVEGKLVPTEAELARQEGRDYESADVLLKRILVERRRRWEEAELEKMKAKGKVPRDDKWKVKYKEPVEPDTEGLPELPEGWCWGTAEALSHPVRSITYGVVKLGPETPGGVPTLRSSNVRQLRLETDYVKPISRMIADSYRRTCLRGGEVLVTVRGTLGGVSPVPDSCKGFNVSREVAVLDLLLHQLGPVVATFIASPVLDGWLKRNTKGNTYTGVNIETLKRLPVPLPPLGEQSRIAEAVEAHLSIEASLSRSVQTNEVRGGRLRQSILKAAFEGKLVPQDPNDEPASVLLERIREEREKAAASSGKGGKNRRTRKKGHHD